MNTEERAWECAMRYCAGDNPPLELQNAIAVAIRAERERCAKVAEDLAGEGGSSYQNGLYLGATRAAKAIRGQP